MKYLSGVVAVGLILLCRTTAMANIYYGTVTETVISTYNTSYQTGSIVLGWYQYESEAIDGRFEAAGFTTGTLYGHYPHSDSATLTLTLSLFDYAPYPGSDGWLSAAERPSQRLCTQLAVTNGIVTNFNMDAEVGALDFSYYFDHFHARFDGAQSCSTDGALSFSNPVLKGDIFSVPDTPNTAALLAASIAGLMLIKIRRAPKNVSKPI